MLGVADMESMETVQYVCQDGTPSVPVTSGQHGYCTRVVADTREGEYNAATEADSDSDQAIARAHGTAYTAYSNTERT